MKEKQTSNNKNEGEKVVKTHPEMRKKKFDNKKKKLCQILLKTKENYCTGWN